MGYSAYLKPREGTISEEGIEGIMPVRDNGSDLDMCKITNQGVTRVWVLTHKSSDSHCEKGYSV